MSLFQNSILKNYKQDEALVASRWAAFQNFLAKVDFLKDVKEEKYQEGFLKDVFEAALGYTLDSTNPAAFNLEREKKNETDAKKADAAIYVDGKVLGVVELKAQDTKNLDKASDQAFGYLVSNSDAHYVVVSNFDELRFYIDKKTSYEKFFLFSLDYETFKRLHLLLSYESIKENLPLTLKAKSSSFEQEISKELYKDFSAFRNQLFQNIVKNNSSDKANLLRLTQKLCDRIIFILFAEDRSLLRHNTIKEIREEFSNQKFTSYALYDIYKFYFDAINAGNEKLGIPKYNGGLFATDEELDSLVIDDASLDMQAQKLSDYDFASDIGVNILGHIFEQSLTDLEEMQANIDNLAFDKKQGKRKKDGVFYTPEYITRYIVENTLGKLCEEKKELLDLASETLVSPKNPKKLTKAELTHKRNIQTYREWLTNLKILDPACGSGAFLNQALEFLIAEHMYVRDLLLPFQDLTLGYEIEKEILEHNLYGIDINEDAVEIAKLSLWLRTAHRGRELTKLADKIVCANSLLEMPFEEGSFDVVIGNPPYGAKTSKENQKIFKKLYKTALYKMDTYSLFIEKGFQYLSSNGFFAYIVPYTWMSIEQHFELRKFLLEKNIFEIVNLPTKIFDDADLDTTILFVKNDIKKDKYITIASIEHEKIIINKDIELKYILQNKELIINLNLTNDDMKILTKIDKNAFILHEVFEVSQGYIPYRRSDLIKKYGEEGNKIVDERLWHANHPKTSEFKQEIQGRDIGRYEYSESFQYVRYGKWLAGYVSEKFFTSPRVLVMEITRGEKYKIKATYINKELYNTPSIINIIHPQNNLLFLKFVLGCINSKLYSWYHIKRHAKSNAETSIPKILVKDIKNLPIPQITKEKQLPFIQLVDEILEAKEKLKEYKTLLDEAIKNDNFDREIKLKKEILSLENLCTSNENAIDQMVYKLYNLTDEEIKIVEGDS